MVYSVTQNTDFAWVSFTFSEGHTVSRNTCVRHFNFTNYADLHRSNTNLTLASDDLYRPAPRSDNKCRQFEHKLNNVYTDVSVTNLLHNFIFAVFDLHVFALNLGHPEETTSLFNT